jgi:hypothetical protein
MGPYVPKGPGKDIQLVKTSVWSNRCLGNHELDELQYWTIDSLSFSGCKKYYSTLVAPVCRLLAGFKSAWAETNAPAKSAYKLFFGSILLIYTFTQAYIKVGLHQMYTAQYWKSNDKVDMQASVWQRLPERRRLLAQVPSSPLVMRYIVLFTLHQQLCFKTMKPLLLSSFALATYYLAEMRDDINNWTHMPSWHLSLRLCLASITVGVLCRYNFGLFYSCLNKSSGGKNRPRWASVWWPAIYVVEGVILSI